MIKNLSKFAFVLVLSMLASFSVAQTTGPVDRNIVLQGALGDCPKGRACMYRVTQEDIVISRGSFAFHAKSTGLCYDQIITINNNGKYVLQERMTGSDNASRRFGVRVNDLLTVYVTEVPSSRVCIWPGELNWQISRNPYSTTPWL
jgi:hypothetical protein